MLKALIVANHFLETDLEKLRAAVSPGYARGNLLPRDRKDCRLTELERLMPKTRHEVCVREMLTLTFLGGTADMAGLAAGSTRSRMTSLGRGPLLAHDKWMTTCPSLPKAHSAEEWRGLPDGASRH